MAFSFSSLAHVFASAASDIVKAGKVAAAVFQKVQADAPVMEAVTEMVSPQAADIERGAFAVLGLAAQAIEQAGDAASQNGVNLQLDAQTVADVKAVMPAIKKVAGQAVQAFAPAK